MTTFNPNQISFDPTKKQESIKKEEILLALKNLESKFHFERINPNEFVSDNFGYTQEDIDNDQDVLNQKRSQYEKLSAEGELQKVKADLLERVITVGIANMEWFGKNAKAFLTSEYDDEINHIDGLVEFVPPKQQEFYRLLGLNFDATFTTNIEGIGTKIMALRADLDRYNIPKAKYFKNPATGMNGVQLPKVILGCDSDHIIRIVKLINKGEFDALKNDPIQDKLLLQAEKQLAEFKTRFGKSSSYYKRLLDEARRDGATEEVIDEADLNHRKFSNLFEMHSQVHGLVNAACQRKGPELISKMRVFETDAVHHKIMLVAEQINPKKK